LRELHHVAHRSAGQESLARDAEDLQKSPVGDPQPVPGIEHAQAQRHVVECRFEENVLLRQRSGQPGLLARGQQQAQAVRAQIAGKLDRACQI
jgi:hypothetical protein